MKENALWWLRMQKNMDYIGTEVGGFNADVFGASHERSIEIEVKISASDLQYDFKKEKHEFYAGTRSYANKQPMSDPWIPNFFYFLVPQSLAELAGKICENKGPKYGVISLDTEQEWWTRRFSVYRRPKRIHPGTPDPDMLHKVARRMANEIIAAHSLKDRVNEIKSQVFLRLEERLSRVDVSTEEEE